MLEEITMESDDSFIVLHNALMEQDKCKRIQDLRTLIDNGIDVNSCATDYSLTMFVIKGTTALIKAASDGYVECVRLLLEAGANVNQSDNISQTALTEAASNGHNECTRLLLEAGAYVNKSDAWHGQTALMEAASRGDVECVRLLVDAGAKVDRSDTRGQTAIMKAANNGYATCVRLLLDVGADLDDVDKRGNTALIYYLTSYDYSDKAKPCFQLLVNDIHARNKAKRQPIHFALKIWPDFKFPTEYLISENCDLNQASYDYVQSVSIDSLTEDDRLNILKLLFACGLPRWLCQSYIVEPDTTVRNWVETVAFQPNTLKSTCVFEIRRNLGLGIKSKVTKLNVPNVIQSVILLKTILSSECFD